MIEIRLVVVRGGYDYKDTVGENLGKVMKLFCFLIVVVVTQIYTGIKTHTTVH